jgi:hypothetical protein
MADLNALLEEARMADPRDRILYRDRIAAYGAAAISAMQQWLGDPRLGAFAVRVLERIAEDDSNRRAVLDALASTARAGLPEHVAHDIAQAIDRLGGTRARGVTLPRPGPRTQVDQWPGHRTPSPLELRFHDAMLGIFTLAGEATRKRAPDGSTIRGYWANYFLRGVRNHGGPDYARQLLRAEGTSDGFQRLTDERRLDLTVEALVLRPEYSELFTDEERAVAASRLARGGYSPPHD